MTEVEITIKLPEELVEDAQEFGVLDNDVIGKLVRAETDQRILDFVNSEIKAHRAEKTGNSPASHDETR